VRRWIYLAAAGAVALVLSYCVSQPEASARKGAPAGNFDFFVLSLAWSPSYCEAEGEDASASQCDVRKDYAFIVHGFWPQYENGYPEYCASREPERVSRELVASVADIMPSAGLVGHQWRKHGSCTGLSQAGYLKATRAAFERIEIPGAFASAERARRVDPDDAERAFLDANPGMAEDGITIACSDGRLSEVRICLTRDLEFRSCPDLDSRECRRANLSLPAAP